MQEGIDSAATKAQPGTSLDRFLINFTKDNPNALTPAEKQISSDATKTDVKGTMYRAAGSRAIPFFTSTIGGAAEHSIPGAAIGAGVGAVGGVGSAAVARNLGFASKLAKVDDLVKSVGSRLPKESPPIPSKGVIPPQPHPSTGGYNPGTEPIPSTMNADFAKNPSPTDLGPVGSASLPGQAGFVSKPNPTDLGYTGGASLPGQAGYVQEPHPSAAGYKGSPVNVQDVANAADPRPSYGAVGNLGFGKPISDMSLPIENWPGYTPKVPTSGEDSLPLIQRFSGNTQEQIAANKAHTDQYHVVQDLSNKISDKKSEVLVAGSKAGKQQAQSELNSLYKQYNGELELKKKLAADAGIKMGNKGNLVTKEQSAVGFIRRMGGIQRSAETDRYEGKKFKGIFNKNGLSPEDMRGALQEEGYIQPEDPQAPPKSTVDDLHNILDRHDSGIATYRHGMTGGHESEYDPDKEAYDEAMGAHEINYTGFDPGSDDIPFKQGGPVKATKGQIAFKLKKTKK